MELSVKKKRKLGLWDKIVFISTVALLVVGVEQASRTDSTVSQIGSPVSNARFAKLRRGINTSHWFSQVSGGAYTKQHFDSHTTEKDIALIRSMGFDHIRFSIEPGPMFNESDPASLPAEYLGYVDSAINMILAHDLAMVVDIHPSDQFKLKLNKDDKHVGAFIEFWRALARHLSNHDPERVFLEVLNEPMVEDGYRWAGIQSKLVAAMREGAPRHTIIVTGHRWSSVMSCCS